MLNEWKTLGQFLLTLRGYMLAMCFSPILAAPGYWLVGIEGAIIGALLTPAVLFLMFPLSTVIQVDSYCHCRCNGYNCWNRW